MPPLIAPLLKGKLLLPQGWASVAQKALSKRCWLKESNNCRALAMFTALFYLTTAEHLLCSQHCSEDLLYIDLIKPHNRLYCSLFTDKKTEAQSDHVAFSRTQIQTPGLIDPYKTYLFPWNRAEVYRAHLGHAPMDLIFSWPSNINYAAPLISTFHFSFADHEPTVRQVGALIVSPL